MEKMCAGGYSRHNRHTTENDRENDMRDWMIDKWTRFKAWLVAALTAIGATLGLVTMAGAALVTFTWTMPTQNTDGSALDASQIVETRLYCDIDPSAFTPQSNDAPASHTADQVIAAPATSGDVELSWGRHDCFATVLAAYDDGQGNIVRMESDPSGIASKIVAPPKPNPPGIN